MQQKKENFEDEKIALPMNLGIRVWKILEQKYNISRRTNKLGLLDFNFSREELELITSLKIERPSQGELQGISLLPNLQNLEIKSEGITAHMQQKNIQSIGKEDLKEIAKCASLKSLSIVNQARADYLDVSKLEQLEILTISHNQHLEEISGMEKLSNLWKLECYGNNRLTSIEGLDAIITQNPELGEVNLDVLLFPNAIGYNVKNGEYNSKALSSIQELSDIGQVSWREGRNGNRAIKINTYQMIQLHNKACKILSENVPESAGSKDIIIGIEDYLSRNVKYDYEGMKNRA